MLLGVDGVCIISHGSTGATAMLNGIKVAKEMVDTRSSPRSHARRRRSTDSPTRGETRSMPAEIASDQEPLDRAAVFEIVRDSLADILEIEPARSARASPSSTTSRPTRSR